MRECICTILRTSPGERVEMPTFGCGLSRFLFEPNTVATLAAHPAGGHPVPRPVGAPHRDQRRDGSPQRHRPARRGRHRHLHAHRHEQPGTADDDRRPEHLGATAVTIPIPVLDDRSFDQLVAEAKARIPVHTPEWTNLNDSDPGHHHRRAVRLPDREPALPLEPHSRGQPDQVPHDARHLAAARLPWQRPGRLLQRPRPAAAAPRAGRGHRRSGPARCRFVVQDGLAVLPVTAAPYYKAPQTLDAATQAQYQLLYQTFLDSSSDVLSFYQPVALHPPPPASPTRWWTWATRSTAPSTARCGWPSWPHADRHRCRALRPSAGRPSRSASTRRRRRPARCWRR